MSDPQEREVFQRIFDSMMAVPGDAGTDDSKRGDSKPDDSKPDVGTRFPKIPGFTILRELGRGGFATVYLAHDEELDRSVALKVLKPKRRLADAARDQFINEARALARVRHPHVLGIYGVEEANGLMALVTEYVPGQDVASILEERGRFSASETARIGVELCQALAAVHAEGLVHRDVKTSNLLREEGGRYVLADFGLGVFVDQEGEGQEGGALLGSPYFMSPEQVKGGSLDACSDLYSVGVVLYHLATASLPCEAGGVTELFGKISRGEFRPLRDVRPDIPSDFAAVVSRALRVVPEERYQSAGELEAALLEFLHASHDEENPRSRARRGPALAVLILLVAALFLAVSWRFGGDSGLTAPRVAFHSDDLTAIRLLEDRDLLRAGDHVFLEFEHEEDLYVYVLNEDSTGRRFLLFPVLGAVTSNPLPGGRRHRLPGVDENWEASPGGGEEWVCVLASREPLEDLEQILTLGAAGGLAEGAGHQYLQVDPVSADRLAGRLRSLGALVPARPELPEEAAGSLDLRDLVVRFSEGEAGANRTVWAKSLRFRND